MNLESAVNTFLLSHPNLGTRKAYKGCLIPMVNYIGPARPADKVTGPDIIEYSATLYTRNYSPATIRKHVISIKAFFNFLVKIDMIEQSPARAVKTPRRKANTRAKAMQESEYKRILEFAAQSSPRNHALILFFADTGCREISARRLRIADIDFAKNTAVITGKGDKTRSVYFGKRCKQALQAWLQIKPANSSDYVFRQRVNRADSTGELKEGVLSQVIRRIAKKHHLHIDRPLGSHSLRHRKGHQLADSGTPLSIAQKALGHADPTTTLVYYPEDDERVYKKMQELATDYTPPKPEKKEELPPPRIVRIDAKKGS
jgi:site-specific recombinase XerD